MQDRVRSDATSPRHTFEVVVVHAGEEPPERWTASVFLAGPTPRTDDVRSWRPEALDLIRRLWDQPGRLVVFVPEPRAGRQWPPFEKQRTWELYWGDRCDEVMFWIPRNVRTLPGLTTNSEWGRWQDSGRAVLGTPPEAEHVRYQRACAAELHAPVADTLSATVDAVLDRIGDGAERCAGQREVPLLVWRTAIFRSWLSGQEAAGNQLRGARVEWTCRVGPTRSIVLFACVHVSVWVTQEQRLKSNEVIIGRPDVATVVAYRRAETLEHTEIVLVREFRSTAATADGYVRELPGGSTFKPNVDPARQAVDELREETGLVIDVDRLRYHGPRQLAATVTTHRQHVHSVELTETELETVRGDTAVHGEAADAERTYPEIWTMQQLLTGSAVDWTTLGILAQVLGTSPT